MSTERERKSEPDYMSDSMMLAKVMADVGTEPRVAAIMGVAYIEKYVTWVLRKKMPNMSSKVEEKLFGFGRPLSGLMSKVHLAHALGFFAETTAKDIAILAQIRNCFAHDLRVQSFDDPPIARLIKKLSDESHWHKKPASANAGPTLIAWATSNRGLFVMTSESISMGLCNWLNQVERE